MSGEKVPSGILILALVAAAAVAWLALSAAKDRAEQTPTPVVSTKVER